MWMHHCASGFPAIPRSALRAAARENDAHWKKRPLRSLSAVLSRSMLWSYRPASSPSARVSAELSVQKLNLQNEMTSQREFWGISFCFSRNFGEGTAGKGGKALYRWHLPVPAPRHRPPATLPPQRWRPLTTAPRHRHPGIGTATTVAPPATLPPTTVAFPYVGGTSPLMITRFSASLHRKLAWVSPERFALLSPGSG